MISHFEETLAGMSDAEFLTMWKEIKQESGEGPNAEKFIADFTDSLSKATVSFNCKGIDSEDFAIAGEYNYAMAA